MAEQILEINRELYDHMNPERAVLKSKPGITEETVLLISKDKKEPEWMLQKRLQALKIYQSLQIPKWGPDLSKLNLNEITYYTKVDERSHANSWDDVPEDIKKTFEKLGIPEVERKALAGAGAQYDSMNAYHSLKKEWEEKGVIFEDCDTALKKYSELVKEYFMTRCVPIADHKFAALHAATWSGGTFIYVPKGVKVDVPLQAYFRINAGGSGQFEHTLIIADEGSELHYIEGCFTKGNIVHTNPDYKPIEEIKQGQKVLTHDGSYKKVKEIYAVPYEGTIKNIKLWGALDTIDVTEDHPFLYVDRKRKNERNKIYEPRWNLPRFFKKGDYLAIPINKTVVSKDYYEVEIKKWVGKKQGYKNIKRKIPSTKEFFKLAGYYLSEGSISSGHYLNFSFSNKEVELMEDVKHLLKKVFNIEKVLEMHHKKNNGTSLVVCSTELCRIFGIFGKKANKKNIPQWMMLEDQEKQKCLIESYFNGDGNYYKKQYKSGIKEVLRLNSVSEKLTKQCRDILLRLGIVSFINARDRSKENRQTMYTLGITGEYMSKFGEMTGIKIHKKLNGKNRASMFGINKDFAFFPIKEINSREVKDEIVYNFSVEANETYCVAGAAAHNCSAPQYNKNNIHAGCVEIYVKKGARVRYSSIENWSKNTYNLNTKRAIVEEEGIMEWINGNLGCLTGDSNVFTNPKGPTKIKDIESGDKVYSWDEKTNSLKRALVKAKIFSGYKKVYNLEAGGRQIEASGNHPFLTLVRRKNNPSHKKGFFHQEWRPLEQLKEGDVVGIARKLPIKGKPYKLPRIKVNPIVEGGNKNSRYKVDISYRYNKEIRIPEETNEDFMWLMGILLGDGYVDSDYNKTKIATHETEDYRENLCKIIEKLFNCKVTEKKERWITFNSKVLCNLFTKIGFSGTAETKQVPDWVFTLPENQMLSFLAGYFDADGHPATNALAFTSINKKIQH